MPRPAARATAGRGRLSPCDPGHYRAAWPAAAFGGAAAGGAIGGSVASGTDMAYTVDLIDGGTVRVVMDSGNFHQGDCVSVERGSTNNMRRVSTEYCTHNKEVPAQYKKEHVDEASECHQAKQELLAAKDEAAVKTAHMKMNILCQD